jgi:hypothetical protein
MEKHMKVKMMETVQGRDIFGTMVDEGIEVSILTPGDVFLVDESLGRWLVDNRKAEEIKPPAIVEKAPVEVKPVSRKGRK